MEKISIIMPVWNAERFLKHSIPAVLNQTYKNIELVCIDDGSSDDSLNILKEFQKQDNRVKVIHQENQGGSGARNTGLDHATGDYIAFLDNDDIYHPQYLEILYKLLKENNADVSTGRNFCFCDKDYYEFKEKDLYDVDKIKAKGIFKNPFFKKFVMKKQIPMFMWLKLAKKEVFKDIRFSMKLPAINDMILNMDVLYNSKKCVTTDKVILAYYYRSDSQTNKKMTSKTFNEFYNLITEIMDFKKRRKLNFMEKWAINRFATKTAYKQFINRTKLTGNFEENKKEIGMLLNDLIEKKYIKPSYLKLTDYIKFKKAMREINN